MSPFTPAGRSFLHCALNSFAPTSSNGIPDEYAGHTLTIENKTIATFEAGTTEKVSTLWILPFPGANLWTSTNKTDSAVNLEGHLEPILASITPAQIETYAAKHRTVSLQVRIRPNGPQLYRGGSIYATRISLAKTSPPYLGKATGETGQEFYQPFENLTILPSSIIAGTEGVVMDGAECLVMTARPKAANRIWNEIGYLCRPTWKTANVQTTNACTQWSGTVTLSPDCVEIDEGYEGILVCFDGMNPSGDTYTVEVIHCIQIAPRLGTIARSMSKKAPPADSAAVETASAILSNIPPAETEQSFLSRVGAMASRLGMGLAGAVADRYAPGLGAAAVAALDNRVDRFMGGITGRLSSKRPMAITL